MMDLDLLDEQLNMMLARAELEGETCGLKHSKKDPSENHPATNFLCQKLGNKKTKEGYQELRIPICEECSEALYDVDWILMYCTYCHKSQWVNREFAKKGYPPGNQVYWLDTCPFCAEIADKPWSEVSK